MNKSSFRILGLILLVFLVGCAENVAKINIQDVGEYHFQLDHAGDELEVWTDLDLEYSRIVEIFYLIKIYQNGSLTSEVVCDPFDLVGKRMERSLDENNLVKLSYLGKMKCSLSLPEGNSTGVVTFVADGDALKVFRADLILK